MYGVKITSAHRCNNGTRVECSSEEIEDIEADLNDSKPNMVKIKESTLKKYIAKIEELEQEIAFLKEFRSKV